MIEMHLMRNVAQALQHPGQTFFNAGLRQRLVSGYAGRRRNGEAGVLGRYDVREKKLAAITTRNARREGQHHKGAW